jgi:hypothetical protein
MNNRLRGGFNHWTLPAAWVPYLQSSQKPILPYFTSKRGFLFITLQGTVYLYSTLSQSGWPIHPFADIPPDATIVAEYVPLSPAVKEGIVPVYNGQPFTSGMTLPPIWKQVTHLSAMPMKGAT